MSRYKEDILEAKERLSAWWDHELIDRPCLSFWTPKSGVKLKDLGNPLDYFDPFFLAEYWSAIDKALDDFERFSAFYQFGGEAIPRFFPNYGAGIMASVFGIEPKFQTRTVWFQRETSVKEIINLLEEVKLNDNNPWYKRLIQVTETAAKRGASNFCVAITDLGGILDILSSFLGPIKVIVTMKRNPDLINACRMVILEKWMSVYAVLQDIIQKYGEGFNSWMNIWCPKRWYPLQSDFSAFLNPKWFKEFVLPDIKYQAEHIDYSIYHLDGLDALKHLDDILNIDSLDGIQWVPGAGKPLRSSDQWMFIYKKIQEAGKSVIIDNFEQPERVAHFYKVLDPKLLFTTLVIPDNVRAAFILPTFMGGLEGKGNFREFKREYRGKRINKNGE